MIPCTITSAALFHSRVLACGQINAKGPFPAIGVLNVDRSAPDGSNLLTVAGAVCSSLECQNADCGREHRARGVGDADALDIAISAGPVLHRIGLSWEVDTKDVDE